MELLCRNGYLLRAPEPEDIGCMCRFENTPALWEVSNTTGPYSRFFLKQYIEENKNDLYQDRQLRLMIEDPEGMVTGIIDLFHFDPFHNRAEIGIVIDSDFRRKGIGTLALDLLVQHCFEHIGIHQLYAYIDVHNEPCRKLFLKGGFKECTRLKDWIRTGKTFSDVVLVQRLND